MAKGLPIEDITYYFFPFEAGEYEGEFNKGKNNGWNYILKNKARWVEAPMLTNLTQSCLLGVDFIIYNNKCYFFDRKYHILEGDNGPTIVVTGKLSKNGADQLT